MSETQDTNGASPTKKVGKKRGPYVTAKKRDDATATLLAQALARIADLEARTVPTTIPAAPEASPENPPGSYAVVFEDPRTGMKVERKVRWTKQSIAAAYPEVRFTPIEEMDVLPHGVKYRLVPEVEFVGPAIVKAIYDEQRKARLNESKAYQWRPSESAEVSAKAIQNPGHKIWSSVSRLGVGITVADDEFPA